MTNNYLVVYAKYKGSNYSGHAPDVPGCVSAADTLEEMKAMMREALEAHLELLAERGCAVPEATTMNVEFKTEDFDDTEYFVIQRLEVRIPAHDHNRESVQAA